jgi:hypothetical protein
MDYRDKRARAWAYIDARGSAVVLREAEADGFHPVRGSGGEAGSGLAILGGVESAGGCRTESIGDAIIVLSRIEPQDDQEDTQHTNMQPENPTSSHPHRFSGIDFSGGQLASHTKDVKVEKLVSHWLHGKGLSIHHRDLIPVVHILCRLKHKINNKDTQASLGAYFEQLLTAYTVYPEHDMDTIAMARGMFRGPSGKPSSVDGVDDQLLFEKFRQYSVLWGAVRIRWE